MICLLLEKLVPRCSNITAMEEDLGSATVLTTYGTQSMKMRKHVAFDHVYCLSVYSQYFTSIFVKVAAVKEISLQNKHLE